MFGGCLWPREVAGEPLSKVGYLFPHSRAMDALLAVAKPGVGISSIWLELAFLADMAAAVLSIAVTVFRSVPPWSPDPATSVQSAELPTIRDEVA